jgi:hypothetical protein
MSNPEPEYVEVEVSGETYEQLAFVAEQRNQSVVESVVDAVEEYGRTHQPDG